MKPDKQRAKPIAAEDEANLGYRLFRQALQEGKLTAGTSITQNELCELLGMSLSPLRETLVLLEEYGLVEIKPRTGIKIVYPEMAFIRENYQFRVMIELHALKLFASSVTGEWMSNMRIRHEEARKQLLGAELLDSVQARFQALDFKFHNEIVEVMDNRAILETHNRLQENISMARRVHRRSVFRDQLIDTVNEHLKVVDALEQRDVDGATEALEAHFHASAYRTMASF